MAKNDNFKDFLKDLADTIREKKGSTELINPQNFSDEIRNMENAGVAYYDLKKLFSLGEFIMFFNILYVVDEDNLVMPSNMAISNNILESCKKALLITGLPIKMTLDGFTYIIIGNTVEDTVKSIWSFISPEDNYLQMSLEEALAVVKEAEITKEEFYRGTIQ